MKQRIVTFDDRKVELYDELELKDAPDIYIYEEGCEYEPKGVFTEYNSLKIAIKENPRSRISRYPSKNIKYEF
jgi:hypothetical protein